MAWQGAGSALLALVGAGSRPRRQVETVVFCGKWMSSRNRMKTVIAMCKTETFAYSTFGQLFGYVCRQGKESFTSFLLEELALRYQEVEHLFDCSQDCFPQEHAADVSTNGSRFQVVKPSNSHMSFPRVKINSREMFMFEPIAQKSNCRNSETVLEFVMCAVQIFWKPETSTETFISIKQYGEDICFKIQPFKNEPYTVSVKREMLDGKLLFLFVAGIFLHHFANSLSKSAKFFYLSGIILGVLALLIFVLSTLKSTVPSGSWMSSLYFIYCFKENMQWLWSEHRNYLLGYFLAVGITSFATCYQHGLLTTELSITLFTWTLQLTAFVLIYCRVTIPQVAYAVIAVSLCSKGLCYPLGAAHHLSRKMKNHFKSKQLLFKYLTEEEYQEQGETETIRALEELCSFCRNPDFPSWLAVSRLWSPHRCQNYRLFPHASQKPQALRSCLVLPDLQFGIYLEQLQNSQSAAQVHQRQEFFGKTLAQLAQSVHAAPEARFAGFVLGSPHISPAETKARDEEYGIGSIYLEPQLFETRAEPEQNDPANSIHEGYEDEDETHKQISFPYDTKLL